MAACCVLHMPPCCTLLPLERLGAATQVWAPSCFFHCAHAGSSPQFCEGHVVLVRIKTDKVVLIV
jgi:hypothetical protein